METLTRVEALPMQEVSADVILEKYAKDAEKHLSGEKARPAIRNRVAGGLAKKENDPGFYTELFFRAQEELGVIMAGRVNSAAGTDIKSTLINCFVEGISDTTTGYEGDVPGIYTALARATESMRRGGGVGYSWSNIRPRGAFVKGTGSMASGPISYMRVFDRSCETVESAGARRGAQMAVLRVDSPSIMEFITAKQKKGELTQFNISVGVTDDFMQAKKEGKPFELVHKAEPCQSIKDAGAYQRESDGLWVYEVVNPQDIWDKIMECTFNGAEPGILFIDQINRLNNLYYCEYIEATNPCGEQPLPINGCCCLGSINLGAHLVKADDGAYRFDWETFASAVRVAIRMLDNVLDVTFWPHEEQRQEAMAKRRIGLGITGLGSMLALLGRPYNSPEGREVARHIAECLRDEAYRASVELAKEKGAFPLFDKDKYLASEFVKRLPEDIRADIAEHGIRNSHLLSIAPTGTISLAFADNTSNGIEPPFTWSYTRNKRESDGSNRSYQVMDSAYRQYVADGGDPDNLPASFVDALSMSPEDHLAMVEVFAPFIDSAISKTINCPKDIAFDDFKDIYEKAYLAGLKGVTTYRPNDITGAVLEVNPDDKAPSDLDFSADRKITIDKVPTPALASLRWPSRPDTPEGNPSVTYMVKSPSHTFSVFVGHIENGKNKVFESWVNGQEQPRGLGALAKLTSMDMRSEDTAWLKAKLDALQKCGGSNPFEMHLPGKGAVVVPSHVSALAQLIASRCEQLGVFDDEGETPLVDSLFSKKEPKAGPDGNMAWSVDLANPATGDDFSIFVKEVVLPDGTHRPFSLWFAGEYPEAFDGLCKSLSIDMRVIDPSWVAKKLRSLADFPEPQGDFLAKIPGGDGKMATQPSTIAYVARLLLHRYRMLGILDNNGYPVKDMGLFDRVTGESVEIKGTGLKVMAGKPCSSCGVSAVIKRDGCDFCTSCGDVGSCG